MTDKREVLQQFVDEVQNLLGESVKKIILYGSYARGDFNINSDMDIMILTSMSDDEIRKIEDELYDIAYECELSGGVFISVNIKKLQQRRENSDFTQ